MITQAAQAVDPRAVTAALADARAQVYWTDPQERERRPAAREPLTGHGYAVDLAIIGAGFTGLWSALQAAEENPGLRIAVLDAGRLGIGASGRNGGFVDPSLTHGLAQGVTMWPDEIDTLERLAHDNIDGFRASLEAHGIEADYHVPGELTLSLSPHQDDAITEAAALRRAHGIPVSELTAEQCRARVDSPLYRAGFLSPEVGLVDPALLVWGLADAIERLGVAVHEDTAVRGFARDGARVRVQTQWGSLLADQVVVGTGAARGVLRRLDPFVLPVYDHVLMSAPLTRDQLTAVGWQGREGLTDAGNQFHYYRRTLDDRVLFGGFDANYHFPGRIDPSLEQGPSHEVLARHFLAIFPQLEGVRFTHRWAGVIDTTSRFTPFFGTAMGGRIAYAVGYTGLGVASTRFGARVVLDLLAGARTERTELTMVRRPPMPFPPEPIRFAAVKATRSALAAEDRTGQRGLWLRALDRLGIGFDS